MATIRRVWRTRQYDKYSPVHCICVVLLVTQNCPETLGTSSPAPNSARNHIDPAVNVTNCGADKKQIYISFLPGLGPWHNFLQRTQFARSSVAYKSLLFI